MKNTKKVTKSKPAHKPKAKRVAPAKTKPARKAAPRSKTATKQGKKLPESSKALKTKGHKGAVAPFVLKARQALCRAAQEMDLRDIRTRFMTVCAAPTGTGKTQAARLLALRCAKLLGKERIVVSSPYVVLCRQTEADWKAAVEPETVIRATHDVHYKTKKLRRQAKAFQFPINIVSTAALIMALTRPNSAKAKSLRNAVVILDDPDQTIPPHAMRFFLDRCREFHKIHGTHFILTSATFPKLWKKTDRIVELSLPPKVEAKLRTRHKTGLATAIDSLDTLALAITKCEKRPIMVVLNTKANSREVFKRVVALQKLLKEGHPHKRSRVFFINTDIHPIGRREQEKAAEKAVDAKEPVIIIGTSCIQAGWDISCGTIFRENAGLIPQHQIEGRVNRNGELPYGTSVIFRLSDGTRLPEVRIPAQILEEACIRGRRLTPTEAILAYLNIDPEAARKEKKLGLLWKCYKETGAGLMPIEKLMTFAYGQKYGVLIPKTGWDKKDRTSMVNGRWSIRTLRKYKISVSKADIEKMRVLLSGEQALIADPEELDIFERLDLEDSGEPGTESYPFLSRESYHPRFGLTRDENP